jgi:hypothetical protein
MSANQLIPLIAVIIVSLALSGVVTHQYLTRNTVGCLALPALFTLTLLYTFCATTIAAGGINVWFGWRLFGAALVGLGSCAGAYRAKQLSKNRT